MSLKFPALIPLGWSAFYEEQLETDEFDLTQACRVMSAHRGEVILFTGDREITLYLTKKVLQDLDDLQVTVGDWLLILKEDESFLRVLDRKSIIKRLAAGTDNSEQMVAANIDVLFIVSSCNDDFNLSRLERYLAFAFDAKVDPVIVLTKQDKCDDPTYYSEQALGLGANIEVELVNALDIETLSSLKKWCEPGQTIALLGSSGVGKSSLVNSLGVAQYQKTGTIREDDARGRHTTTHRSLLQLENGAILMDSPGMRGIGLVDGMAGVAETFEDITEFTHQCRFNDCSHELEPGCAVKQALKDGVISERRFSNYSKLMAEQTQSVATIAERRKKDKETAKLIKKSENRKKAP